MKTQWEYLVLTSEPVASGYVRFRYANGREIEDWQRKRPHDVLNEFGTQGWELVSTSMAIDDRLYLFYWAVMKRPKEGR